jgi:hypothetical protein
VHKQSLRIISMIGMTLIPLLAGAQPATNVRPREVFTGSVSVLNKGAPQALKVNYKTWFIREGRSLDLPAGGSLVVEVASGAVTAILDGHKQAEQFGEFFVVPAGHKLQLVTANRSALLRTLELGGS